MKMKKNELMNLIIPRKKKIGLVNNVLRSKPNKV